MASKYDAYWLTQLDRILALFDHIQVGETSLELDGLSALGDRRSWYGKLEIVNGQPVYDSAAHLKALGLLLAKRLPEWTTQFAWILTISQELQLTIEQVEPARTNWFESAYRAAKLDETIRRASVFLGPLIQDTTTPNFCYTASGDPVYVMFSAQQSGWIAPRRNRLEKVTAMNSQVVISLTNEESDQFNLWVIPAAELSAAIQRKAYTPTLDRGNAYNFNLATDSAADVIRQLDWDIRPYRREAGQTEITRSKFWPANQQPVSQIATGESVVDVSQRLAQWRAEATDPTHPNHYHADLDHPIRLHNTILGLLQKLRTTPEEFGRADVVALFGALNSGPRMKNKVADENPLPLLRETLLGLVDGTRPAAEKITAAAQALKFAGANTLGELYGWANAETAPLYNGCATAALHHLGYAFDDRDYSAFVAAHEQFKQVYRQEVGQLRPELPINLEIDKLYNVIDKVDLKGNNRRPLAKPFNEMFADWEEAERVFDALAETARQLGITDPADERLAINLRYKEGKHQLRFSYGWWLVLGFAGAGGRLRETILALSGDHFPSQPLRVEQFKQEPGEQPVSLYWYPAHLLWPFTDDAKPVFAATLQQVKSKFDHWVRCPYRIHTKEAIIAAVFDRTARAKLLSQGWPPSGVALGKQADDDIDELRALEDQPDDHQAEIIAAGAPFTSRTFELLEGLHGTPTKAYYQTHKEGFKEYVEEPFQRIFRQVAQQLPAPMQAALETEKGIFARILKNDWGQGGAWQFYWGAFYPKGGKRTEDAQLSMWIDYRLLEHGFYIGDYGSAQRERFQRNCQAFGPALLPYLQEALPESLVRFADREHFEVSPDGAVTVQAPLTWEDFLKDPARAKNDVSIILPRPQLLALSEEQLVAQIAESYRKLFPLVLLATEENPLPVIERYQRAVGLLLDEVDAEPPAPYARHDFLARTYLRAEQADDLYDMLLEKKQLILYGPPGTGKTYVAQELAKWLTGLAEPSAERLEMVQFHPAYSYEDFIEGIRPESKRTDDGRFMVDYPPRAGVFRRFCRIAQANPDQPHVFIIDEINRGNIPRIFGELMLLLEYRERDVPLPYSGERFRIPPNVYLIGTMNTADRSIALVDFALRRRFHFFHFRADPDLLERWLAQHRVSIPYLAPLYRRLSKEAIVDPDYAVGVSYFMDPNLTEAKLARIWRYSILPYLIEYHVEQDSKWKIWEWDSELMRGIRGEM